MDDSQLDFRRMDNRQIRRENLLQLIHDYGSIEALADAAGDDVNPSYISQIKNDSRGMGARFARKLEERLGLQAGWMDLPRSARRNHDEPIPLELALFRRLSRKQREAITLILQSMVRRK